MARLTKTTIEIIMGKREEMKSINSTLNECDTMKYISSYNLMDCKILMEIVQFLSQNGNVNEVLDGNVVDTIPTKRTKVSND